MTIIKYEDIKINPVSSNMDCSLFFWENGLFKAPFPQILSTVYDLISEPIPLQKLTKTEFILHHPEHGELPVFECIYYNHLIKIQESVPVRVVEFIKAICKINIALIKKGYILRDIHEGNIYDSIHGVVWVDWGAVDLLKNALSSLALSLYLTNKYLYNKGKNHTHDTCDILQAQNIESPVTHIAKLDPENIDTWIELSNVVGSADIVSTPSHWADEYATNVTSENIARSNDKGKHVAELLSKIKYDTLTDIGCNKGYYTMYAAKNTKSAVGIDVDEKCISFAIKNTPKNIPVIFAKKNIEEFTTYEQTSRYNSDLVMALAIVHHVPISHVHFANIIVKLSKKYILIEDIETLEIYQKVFEDNGFALIDRKVSFPAQRTLSLYSKKVPNDPGI